MPRRSASRARSIDCRSASAAERVSDCGEGVQWPNERKPIFFMQHKSTAFHDVIINSTSQVLASRSTTHLNCYFISPVTALTGPYDGTARFGERQPDNFQPARLDS